MKATLRRRRQSNSSESPHSEGKRGGVRCLLLFALGFLLSVLFFVSYAKYLSMFIYSRGKDGGNLT